jgi:oxygen-independent coproporphyrinogen-3 oxidase
MRQTGGATVPAMDAVVAESVASAPPVPSEALLRRMDRPGPRYTSYPTADRFTESVGPERLLDALRARRARRDEPLALYVHIPFCESVCYYCACNKIVTRHHERAADYLADLGRELDLQVEALGRGHALHSLHLGGGTPTFLSDAELAALMARFRAAFAFTPDAEVSIEVDPRTVDAQRLAHLHQIGFNRLSFGVQDFDPDVQVAVHRVQPYEQVAALMRNARAIGFASINVDLIYGLPKQTPASFNRTIAQVATLRPDRIALYAYAHLPTRFKPQRRIVSADLPMPGDRVQMIAGALAAFVGHGYVTIGMDHFALPEDALAVARREGRLRRNFQGYTTLPDGDLLALGVSAIGRMGDGHTQNAKTLDAYHAALREGRLPVERGYALSADDRLRREVVMALMCQGRVDLLTAGAHHGVDAATLFAPEFARLAPFIDEGLVEVDGAVVSLTPMGWLFVRAVAMVFDAYLGEGAVVERFSRIV